MFTGIIKHTGTVNSLSKDEGLTIDIDANGILDDIEEGESIAVDGVRLTVVAKDGDSFKANIIPETVKLTTIGQLKSGDTVNLELPLKINEDLSGHVVLGHVDGVAKVVDISKAGTNVSYSFEVPEDLIKYIAFKGSITINGVSLIVTSVEDNVFSLALTPHTLKVTNLSDLEKGSLANIEVDVIARYIEKLIDSKLESFTNLNK